MPNEKIATAFEASLFDVLRVASRLTRGRPQLVARALRVLHHQRQASARRAGAAARGLHVPPFVIYSVTAHCNLQCEGCYAHLLHCRDVPELPTDRVRSLLLEARNLGVSVILLAGGEPLVRPDLLELLAERPDVLFLLFTNGLLLEGDVLRRVARMPHVIPVLSVEGGEPETDSRRGAGTFHHVMSAMDRLQAKKLFFGTSTTLTQRNFDLATCGAQLRALIARGCRLFYFINYVPVKPGTDHLQLDPAQVAELDRRLMDSRRRLPAVFIAFPRDELAMGGCLAAGRGFLHINAYGDVEPCPFSPYSDASVAEASLEEALSSPLFRAIRAAGDLDETDGRCALWKKREWVAGLVEKNGP
ncbi:MAG: radical SAM protein [Candidatus Bipolaricaulota bacterium]